MLLQMWGGAVFIRKYRKTALLLWQGRYENDCLAVKLQQMHVGKERAFSNGHWVIRRQMAYRRKASLCSVWRMMPKLTERLGRSCSSALFPTCVVLLLLSCSESGVGLQHDNKCYSLFVSRRPCWCGVGEGEKRKERKGKSVRSDLLVITSRRKVMNRVCNNFQYGFFIPQPFVSSLPPSWCTCKSKM
jgi:hypothetical protein